MKRPSAGCLKRVGYVFATLVCVEALFTLMESVGPLTAAYVAAYNGIQHLRAYFPTPTRIWRRRKAAGPPPDPRVVGAGNEFGLRVFRRLCDASPGRNVFYSPYSANAAMCLTLNGAGGATKTGMESALGLNGIPLTDVNKAQRRMVDMLNYSDPAITVTSANSIWAATTAPLNAAFLKTATDSYGAHAEKVNLTLPATAGRISDWMKDHTVGHITGGIPPLTANDGLLLVNALYFHGVWQQKFNRSDTYEAPFRLTDTTQKQVQMMERYGGASILHDMASEGRFTAARIPYGDGSMAMYLFVPDEEFDLAGFLKRVDRANWDKWMAGFRPAKDTSVGLPRMSLRFDQRLDGVFNAMGMRLDQAHANFTPMGSNLYFVSQVSQQAVLDVDEDGTTAAAITIELVPTAGLGDMVIADRPFFLAIRDDRSGAILFAGAIYDPQPDKQPSN